MSLIGQFLLIGINVLKTTVDTTTKTILAQLGDVIGSDVEGDNAEWWQHVGFSSRPSNPVAGVSAAEAIGIRASDRDLCFGSRDLRSQGIYGSLSDGETCVWAGGSDGAAQGRILLKANGNVSVYTAQGNVAGGPSVTMQANADGSINLASQYGAIQISNAGIKLMFGNSSGIQCDANGVTFIGTNLGINASSVGLGSVPVQGVCLDAEMRLQLLAIVAAITAINAAFQATAGGGTLPADPGWATFKTAIGAANTACLALAALPIASTTVTAAL